MLVARRGERFFLEGARLSFGIRAMRTDTGTRYWPNRLVCHCRSWTWLRFDDADARWYADGHKKAKDEKIPGQQVGILTKHVDKIDFIRVFFEHCLSSLTVSFVFIFFYIFFFFLFTVFVIFLCSLLIVFGEIWFDFILSRIIGLGYWSFIEFLKQWYFGIIEISNFGRLKVEKFEKGKIVKNLKIL